MSLSKKQLGDRGELLARHFLEKKSYEIIASNKRIGRAEIDLIARHNNQTIFIEVKTRSNQRRSYPEEAIDARKNNMLVNAADTYCLDHPEIKGIRFDMVSVVLEGSRSEIMHFEDSIWPWSE